jgi:hypothetical protein
LERSVPRYRCYFIAGESIKAAENIEAAGDAEALAEAEKLILKSDFSAIEVWQEKRFVGRHTIAPDINVIVGGKLNSTDTKR